MPKSAMDDGLSEGRLAELHKEGGPLDEQGESTAPATHLAQLTTLDNKHLVQQVLTYCSCFCWSGGFCIGCVFCWFAVMAWCV